MREFRRDNPTHAPGGTVMVGDSITQGFPYEELFPDAPIINRGISGDRIIGIIARLEESIFDLDPAKIFLLIGVNDAGLHPEMELPEYERQGRYLFDQIRRHCPDAEVHIQSLMPTRGECAHANPRIREVNRLLQGLSREFGFHFLDLHPHFCNGNGEMREGLSNDGVHPNARGCEMWRELLAPHVQR